MAKCAKCKVTAQCIKSRVEGSKVIHYFKCPKCKTEFTRRHY
jgi:hypothetical protein